MKRLIMLAVLCAFVLSAAAASAADIKASGAFTVEAVWKSNWNFTDGSRDDVASSAFDIEQRADVVFEFIANENLKGVLFLRYGTGKWGQGSFALGAGDGGQTLSTAAAGAPISGSRIAVRRAYIDFNWPDTTINVKAGYQAVTLPNAFGGGSMILDEEVASAVVSGAITDNVGYLFGFARAATGTDLDATAATLQQNQANADVWVAALPMNFEGFNVAPFGAVAALGKGFTGANSAGLQSLNATTAAGKDTFDTAYWLGAAFTMDLFDPFVLKADVNYGKVTSDIKNNEKDGWLFDAALEYKGFDFMTPELFFVYTTGEDDNSSKGNGSERMPIIQASNWAVGSFFFGGDTLLDGSFPGAGAGRPTYLGFWALGLSLKDIQSFADGLTHTAHFIYAKGTNDKNIGSAYTNLNAGATTTNTNVAYGRTLTEKDSLIEIDFNTAYKVYDELTLTLDLGYINLDAKSSVWNFNGANQKRKGGDAWKVSTGVVYAF
ncbi:outer membrane homotrimeric porin [uncultured Pseudodesulfovibrio sp.]|uniref:outer membrane homotrimeric porin n=1 Tax=uncultured Pseudodesulfovibrio sp. TaxID=2035858 RepID=UPI0029C6AF35|nr:outer membrane homotrimeric porin [uncultured Pseudodesulfovibrio sp.]